MFEKLKHSPIGKTTIANINNCIETGLIDFTPDYQRFGRLWDKSKKQLFIDSIINSYDVPKFYFHYLSSYAYDLNNSNCLLAIIDGKQRLEAINDFINNRFSLASDFVYIGNSNIVLNNKYFRDIYCCYPEIMNKFLDYILDVVFIDTDEKFRIEELFLRLNEGIPLNNAERRNAIGGELVHWINFFISTDPFFTEKISFKNKRLEHFDLLTKLILLQCQGIASFSKRNLNTLIKSNKDYISPLIEMCLSKLQRNVSLMNRCFEDNDLLLRSKSMVPLYYLFFFFRENVSREDIQSQIEFLREFDRLRKENVAIKDPNLINKEFVEFDRLTQQGAHQKTSLEKRLKMLNAYYELFRTDNFNILSECGIIRKNSLEDV
ncbi:DUF262 domain-containing protein [Butyricimonas paravirosa]|uniref:DUF262 domain-containing protein n=1 Tax=Butyricimonas paravirosa TaxID=1472417 RepID=UPI002A837700|nr:DUF262 domain-containing protein [Butyricimonas paravirosa]